MKYAPQRDWKTSKGNVAPDFHLISSDFTVDQKTALKKRVEQKFPGARVMRHATGKYNCHGYAHAGSHAWFNDISLFLFDDYYPFTPGQLKVHDIVVYVKNNKITHSGIISQLSGNRIVEVRSKWGKLPEILHAPEDVPKMYGTILHYLRKRGVELFDTPEPTENEILDKVGDLLVTLTSEERLAELDFASTPDVMQDMLSQFSEIAELSLYGSVAGHIVAERLEGAEGSELSILAHTAGVLGYTEALPAIAANIAKFENDGTVSPTEELVLSAFERLKSKWSDDRKSRAINEARTYSIGN